MNKETLGKRSEIRAARGDRNSYVMAIGTGWFVDATDKGGLSRFLNSSCDPNCEVQKWFNPSTGHTHLGIFSLRSIDANEELTIKYSFDAGQVGHFKCVCNSINCISRRFSEKGRRPRNRKTRGRASTKCKPLSLRKKKLCRKVTRC